MKNFKIIKGDLIKNALDGRYDAIAHGCNAFNCMGAGIAAGIKRNFPSAYDADCKTVAGDISKLGGFTYSISQYENTYLMVFNIYSQFTYFANIHPLDYEALALGLRKMSFQLRTNWQHVEKIGIPLIGFGLAGGDLDRIIQIMHRELSRFDVEVVVYENDANADATMIHAQSIVDTLCDSDYNDVRYLSIYKTR